MIYLGYGPNNTNLDTEFKDIHINDYLKPVDLIKVNNLLLQNIQTLENIIDFNIKHDIKVYCVSDYLIPHAGFYNLEDLPDWSTIENKFYWIAHKINANNIKVMIKMSDRQGLSYSKKKGQTKIFNRHRCMGLIMDLLEQPQSIMSPIVINPGYHYNYLEGSLKRAHKVAKSLGESFYNRCVITNSLYDRGYDIKTLLELNDLFPKPIAFNYHHFRFKYPESQEKDYFLKCLKTWEDFEMFCLYGEPTSTGQYTQLISKRITTYPELYGNTVNIVIKSYQNELSVFKYIRDYPFGIKEETKFSL